MTVPYLKLTKKIGVGIRKACRFYASGKNKNETDFGCFLERSEVEKIISFIEIPDFR